MPAYRSDAEDEIRQAVISKLRKCRPHARIIHEINVQHGKVRVDVMAVSVAEIVTVEIKSERDKLDRLDTQLQAMRQSSHTAIAALHRKFMPELTSHSVPRLEGMPYDQVVWWYPSAQDMAEAHHPAFTWEAPPLVNYLQTPLPVGAVDLLHAHELRTVCERLSIQLPKQANMAVMTKALLWGANGRDITHGICRALREREWAAEADPPICHPDDQHNRQPTLLGGA